MPNSRENMILGLSSTNLSYWVKKEEGWWRVVFILCQMSAFFRVAITAKGENKPPETVGEGNELS
jgi:hypothetical protein